jgi:hypothetical protein
VTTHRNDVDGGWRLRWWRSEDGPTGSGEPDDQLAYVMAKTEDHQCQRNLKRQCQNDGGSPGVVAIGQTSKLNTGHDRELGRHELRQSNSREAANPAGGGNTSQEHDRTKQECPCGQRYQRDVVAVWVAGGCGRRRQMVAVAIWSNDTERLLEPGGKFISSAVRSDCGRYSDGGEASCRNEPAAYRHGRGR